MLVYQIPPHPSSNLLTLAPHRLMLTCCCSSIALSDSRHAQIQAVVLRPLRFAFNYFLPLVDYDKVAREHMQGVVLSSFCIKATVLLINLSLTHTSKCMQTKAARGSEGQQCWWLVGLFGTGPARTPQPRAPFRSEAGGKAPRLGFYCIKQSHFNVLHSHTVSEQANMQSFQGLVL